MKPAGSTAVFWTTTVSSPPAAGSFTTVIGSLATVGSTTAVRLTAVIGSPVVVRLTAVIGPVVVVRLTVVVGSSMAVWSVGAPSAVRMPMGPSLSRPPRSAGSRPLRPPRKGIRETIRRLAIIIALTADPDPVTPSSRQTVDRLTPVREEPSVLLPDTDDGPTRPLWRPLAVVDERVVAVATVVLQMAPGVGPVVVRRLLCSDQPAFDGPVTPPRLRSVILGGRAGDSGPTASHTVDPRDPDPIPTPRG